MGDARSTQPSRRVFRPRRLSLRRLARRRAIKPPNWRFRPSVITLIAATSLFGATVTWAAADVAARASEYDGRYVRDLAQREQIGTRIAAVVAYDERLFSTYRSHIRAWSLLSAEAADVETSDPVLFERLTLEGLGHLAVARGMRPLFRAQLPALRDGSPAIDADPAYDHEGAVSFLELGDPRLGQLDPESLKATAQGLHRTSTELVAVVIALVAALFLLTLAQMIRNRVRLLLAALGALLSIGGTAVALVVWLVVM